MNHGTVPVGSTIPQTSLPIGTNQKSSLTSLSEFNQDGVESGTSESYDINGQAKSNEASKEKDDGSNQKSIENLEDSIKKVDKDKEQNPKSVDPDELSAVSEKLSSGNSSFNEKELRDYAASTITNFLIERIKKKNQKLKDRQLHH